MNPDVVGRTGTVRYLRAALAVAVAAVATVFVVRERHDVGAIHSTLARVDSRYWVAAFLASALLAVSTGGVYRHCLRAVEVDVPLSRTTRLALASHAFSCVMPAGKTTSVVLFTAEADRRTEVPGRGAAGFFTASIVGRIGLSAAAIALVPLSPRLGIALPAACGLLAIYVAIIAGRVGALALVHRRRDRMVRWEMALRRRWRRRGVARLRCDEDATWSAGVGSGWGRRSEYLPAIGWSVLGKIGGTLLVATTIRAVGGSVPLSTAAAIYVFATLAGMLIPMPVGLGVVELTMLHAFQHAGLDFAQAASAMLLYRLFQLWVPFVAGGLGFIGLRRIEPVTGEPPLVLTVVRPEFDRVPDPAAA